MKTRLTTETIEGTTLSLERVDNIERSNCLAFGMFGVCDGIANNTLKEGLEDTTSLLVYHSGNTLDTTTTCETTDSRLCDTLDVVTKNLPVALGTTLSETLATFSTF
jgi:hypothetical protein